MKLYRRSENKLWYFQFDDPNTGKRRRLSTGCTDRQEAHQVATRKYREIINGVSAQDKKSAGRMTLKQAMRKLMLPGEDWSSVSVRAPKTIMSNYKQICADEIAEMDVRKINYPVLMGFVQRRMEIGNKGATINRKLAAVSKALHKCTQWVDPKTGQPYLTFVPDMPYQREDNYQDRWVNELEEQKILDELDAIHRETRDPKWLLFKCLIVVLIDTGMRLNEALSMNTDWMVCRETEEGEQWHLALPGEATKNGKPRFVPLGDRTVAYLNTAQSMMPGGQPFGLWDRYRAWKRWTKVRDRVPGLDDVKLHTLRHTRGTRLAMAGVRMEKIALWLGHETLAITHKRYVHFSVGALDDVKSVLKDEEARRKPTLQAVR